MTKAYRSIFNLYFITYFLIRYFFVANIHRFSRLDCFSGTPSVGKLRPLHSLILLSLIFTTSFVTPQGVFAENAGFRLPPAPIPSHEKSLAGIQSIRVKQFKFEGNLVFSDQQLQQITNPYLDRMLTMQDLIRIKQQLSQFYIDKGYINSGAILADQKVHDGTIHYQIIEGRLTHIDIENHGRIAADYLLAQLDDFEQRDGDIGESKALNLFRLQKSLKLIEQGPLVDSIDAQLKPGLKPGQGHLHMAIREAKAYEINYRMDNHRSPSIGAMRGQFEIKHANLFGYGEQFYLNYGILDDQDDYLLNLSIPLDANRTRAGMSIERDSSSVLSEPFNRLGFRNDLRRYSFRLNHRYKYLLDEEMSMGLQFSITENETQLLGEPFAFPPGVAEARVNELSIYLNWVKRNQNRVLALRSELGVGLPGLDATERDNDLPDGRFVRWNTQFQWLNSLPFWSAESLLRVNFQLSNDNLLSMNQFALGGAKTVRGYRENTLVRDNGVVVSLETHIPLSQFNLPVIDGGEWSSHIKIVPFFDYGYAWNHNDFLFDSQQISSMGIGLVWKVAKRLHAEIYWGKDLHKTDIEYDSNIQDQGIHMQFVLNLM